MKLRIMDNYLIIGENKYDHFNWFGKFNAIESTPRTITWTVAEVIKNFKIIAKLEKKKDETL